MIELRRAKKGMAKRKREIEGKIKSHKATIMWFGISGTHPELVKEARKAIEVLEKEYQEVTLHIGYWKPE
jgi:hypothetical protein